jgi:branched-chain amino acid transport system substrate-binding protein
LRRKGLASFIVRADASRMATALEQANRASALLIDLGLEGAEALGEQAPAALEGEPKVVASLATPGLATVMRLFPGRVVGFTAVVPQPELPNSALVRSLLRDSEAIGPEAMTYEGLEAYVGTLVALEAIRRAGPQANAGSVGVEMARLGHVELGGFAVTFGRPGRSASEWVDIGLRARNGVLMR